MKLTIKKLASILYDDYIASNPEDPKEDYETFSKLFDFLDQMELKAEHRKKLVAKITDHECAVERYAYIAGFIRSYEICQLIFKGDPDPSPISLDTLEQPKDDPVKHDQSGR